VQEYESFPGVVAISFGTFVERNLTATTDTARVTIGFCFRLPPVPSASRGAFSAVASVVAANVSVSEYRRRICTPRDGRASFPGALTALV
jgi:hypothetical protein